MVASEGTQQVPAAINIMIVESRPFFTAGLRRLLSGHGAVEVIADVVDVQMSPAVAAAMPPDVVLLSHALADDLDGALRHVRSAFPAAPVLLYGIPQTSDIAITALRLGVRGLIDEDASLSDLIAAVHNVASGGVIISPPLASSLAVLDAAPLAGPSSSNGAAPRLTSRELDVLQLVATGLSNRSIAASFGLSEHTIRAHLREVMRKLSARSRIGAVTLAIGLGLIHPPHRDARSGEGEQAP